MNVFSATDELRGLHQFVSRANGFRGVHESEILSDIRTDCVGYTNRGERLRVSNDEVSDSSTCVHNDSSSCVHNTPSAMLLIPSALLFKKPQALDNMSAAATTITPTTKQYFRQELHINHHMICLHI